MKGADSLRTIAVAFASRTPGGPLALTQTGQVHSYTPTDLQTDLQAERKAGADTTAARR